MAESIKLMDIEYTFNDASSKMQNETDKLFASFQSKQFTGHRKKVLSLQWNLSGQYLASACADSLIRIWNFKNNDSLEKYIELKGHTDAVEQIAWHPESESILASISSDKTLRIWDVRASTKNQVRTEKMKVQSLNISWRPDGKVLAVGNKEDIISFYDFAGQSKTTAIKFQEEINEFVWDKTGSSLFIATGTQKEGPILIIDGLMPSNIPKKKYNAHQGTCYCVCIDKQNKRMATGGADAIILIWDLAEMIPQECYSQVDGSIRQISFSSSGDYLATATESENIDIIKSQNGSLTHRINSKNPVYCLSWHPKNFVLAYTNDDKRQEDGLINLFYTPNTILQ